MAVFDPNLKVGPIIRINLVQLVLAFENRRVGLGHLDKLTFAANINANVLKMDR